MYTCFHWEILCSTHYKDPTFVQVEETPEGSCAVSIGGLIKFEAIAKYNKRQDLQKQKECTYLNFETKQSGLTIQATCSQQKTTTTNVYDIKVRKDDHTTRAKQSANPTSINVGRAESRSSKPNTSSRPTGDVAGTRHTAADFCTNTMSVNIKRSIKYHLSHHDVEEFGKAITII